MKKAFSNGIVPAISLATHALNNKVTPFVKPKKIG
jgi:hypothetical protein